MVKISQQLIGSWKIPLPPSDEQARIVEHLNQIRRETTALIHCIRKQIEKLREYRQTLISAAVTGQVPVPQEVPA